MTKPSHLWKDMRSRATDDMFAGRNSTYTNAELKIITDELGAIIAESVTLASIMSNGRSEELYNLIVEEFGATGEDEHHDED